MKNIIIVLMCVSVILCADQGSEASASSKPWTSLNKEGDLPVMNANEIIREFKKTYQSLGKPRVLLYVNRRLVKDRGELLVTSENSNSVKTKGDSITTSSGGAIQIGSGNRVETSSSVSGKGGERLETTQKSDRVYDTGMQGVRSVSDREAREIEESFQQPWMDAGVLFVDQRIAQISNKVFSSADTSFLTSLQENKEKEEIESLKKSADWVIEIMTQTRTVKILMASGNDRIEERPSYVATVIRLKDGVKLAQVNSDTLFGFNKRQGEKKLRQLKQVTGAEIAEQTALSVMQRINPE